MRGLLFINGRGITDLLKDRVGVIILYSHLIYLLLYFTFHSFWYSPFIKSGRIKPIPYPYCGNWSTINIEITKFIMIANINTC